jgi:mRNA-degrading endonuclease RelE of RelBE toxin-antitoxin system
MFHIEWLTPAFEVLENLPQSTFVKIVRKVDMLGAFPEMGTDLGSRFSGSGNYRQFVINRDYRVITKWTEVKKQYLFH